MAQRRHHYERAFEAYLRGRRVPYIAVDEAKKSLVPEGARAGPARFAHEAGPAPTALKSFDFVIYGERANLLVDVKGRRVPHRLGASRSAQPGSRGGGRLENWVTQDDIESLGRWEQLFGAGFEAAFIFLYWCDGQPPDALFQEVFEERGRWYAVRWLSMTDYVRHMKVRSTRWRTVDLRKDDFERLSRPFLAAP